MTEYDFSPEAWERYMATQQRIARWVEHTDLHTQMFRSPFELPPCVDGRGAGRSESESDRECRSGSDSGVDSRSKMKRAKSARSARVVEIPLGDLFWQHAGYDQYPPNVRDASPQFYSYEQPDSKKRHRSHRDHHYSHHQNHPNPAIAQPHYIHYPEPHPYQAYAQQPQPQVQPQQSALVYDDNHHKRERRRHRHGGQDRHHEHSSRRRLDRKTPSSSTRRHLHSASSKDFHSSSRSRSKSHLRSPQYTQPYPAHQAAQPPVAPIYHISSCSASFVPHYASPAHVVKPANHILHAPQVYPAHLQFQLQTSPTNLYPGIVPIPTSSTPEATTTSTSQDPNTNSSSSSSSFWASVFRRKGKKSNGSGSGSKQTSPARSHSQPPPQPSSNIQPVMTPSSSDSSPASNHLSHSSSGKSKSGGGKSRFLFFRSRSTKSKSTTATTVSGTSLPNTPHSPPHLIPAGSLAVLSSSHIHASQMQRPYAMMLPPPMMAVRKDQHQAPVIGQPTNATSPQALGYISSGLGMGSFVNVVAGTIPPRYGY